MNAANVIDEPQLTTSQNGTFQGFVSVDFGMGRIRTDKSIQGPSKARGREA